MNFKKYHASRNLFDGTLLNGYFKNNTFELGGSGTIYKSIKVYLTAGTYTISTSNQIRVIRTIFDDVWSTQNIPDASPYNFSVATDGYIGISIQATQNDTPWDSSTTIMLNSGSTPLPYEPYSSEVWHDTPYYIHKTSTDTITTLPSALYPNTTTATVGLKGQAVQSSTPSPTSPVTPEGCGERTAQIIEYPYVNKSDTIDGVQWTISENGHIKGVGTTNRGTNLYINRNCFLKAGTYTLKIYGKHTGMVLRLYDSVNTTIIATIIQSSTDSFVTFTLDSDTSNKCGIYFNVGSAGVDVDIDCDIMLNSGSTALPYEPYGFEISISSAGQTTPVYLGEVETTRKIKKLVLDGTENWLTSQENYYISVVNYYNLYDIGTNLTICSHFEDRQELVVPDGYYGLGGLLDGNTNTKWNGNIVFNPKPLITTLRDWMNYLAAQYAAGTPVCIWYVLATEETAVVNEPLMRIGDYADTLSNVSIPVTAGGDTLSVGTTVQPSEITVNYKGWHSAVVHERSKNLFDYVSYFDSVFTPYNEFFNYSSIQLLPNTTYTLSTSIAEYGTNPRNTAFIVATTNQTPTTVGGGISNISPITITTENDGMLKLYKRISGNGILPTKDLFDAGDWLMLNEGNTALPYEPYWK